ncbi:MAG TPA: conjugal transfer protein TraG N-terminal domain-containing protein [Gammaproteobacteria bacterium]|nr:conjugal transfer protein TraG N-terminal domain-containing protein [Gammaproteobacteria bacterium]
MSLIVDVIVYGNGDLFREYFNAIVTTFGKGNGHSQFTALLRIAILLAGFTVICSYTMRRDLMDIVKWLGIFYIVIYVLFIPEATVVITDRVNGDAKYTVDHVPRGLALFAGYTSVIGDALTQSLESNFTMPDDLRYHQTGMVFSSRLVEAASQFEITDAVFDNNLKKFVHQCVFYDVLLNKYSLNDLVSTNNVWELISANASPARSFIYEGEVTTCREGVRKLTHDWQAVIAIAEEAYGKRIFSHLSKEKAKARLISALPISYQYLTNLSSSANHIMQQNLMANAIQRGVMSMSAELNAPAALEAYAFTRAQEQKRLNNKTLGDMAAHWLPLMKNAFEAIMYASFIFIILLSVFPFGLMILKNYVYTLLWIQIWAPLYAVINLIVSYYAQRNSIAAANGVLSLSSLSGVLQVNADISGLAGYLTLSVPFISAGLVRGMAATFTHLSQYVGGVTQSAGGAASAEAVTGNLSFGNTNFGNHSAFNTSANHVDTSGRVSAGSFTTQMPGGSSLMLSADGSGVLDSRSAISNLGINVNFAESLRAHYSHQADRAYTAAQSDGHAYSEAVSGSVRQMNDLAHHLNKSGSSGHSWSSSTNSAVGQAVNENQRLTAEFAERHHLSHDKAANVLASAYASGQAGIEVGTKNPAFKVGGGVSGGMSRTASHNDATSTGAAYSDAQTFVKDSNYAKNIDTVTRAVKDHSFRLNDEEGDRLVGSMAASLDKAESHRHDMQTHLSQAESARTMASFAQEKSESININENQHFKDWLINQPGTNGEGRLGYRGAERMVNKPEMMRYYAGQYMEQNRQRIESNWNQQIPHTQAEIEHSHRTHQSLSKGESSPKTFYQRYERALTQQANNNGLIQGQTVDKSIASKTEHAMMDAENQVNARQNDILEQGSKEEKQITTEQQRKRHGSLYDDMLNDIDTKNYK